MSILDLLQLNDPQREAATAAGDVVVTAGAGSGKTRTLVGRYLALLDDEIPLRSIVAITFTVKAAREMRTRIRRTIAQWLETPRGAEDAARWRETFADLDAARIGTIHSLCAQILGEHPVEAARLGYLPGTAVLEEGRAAVLRQRAVEEALAWAAEDEAASQLFGALGEHRLRSTVVTLLDQRLDADAAFDRLGTAPLARWADAVWDWLDEQLDRLEWRELFADLSRIRSDDPEDNMEIARRAVLTQAEAVTAARQARDLDAALEALAALRSATALGGRKGNWAGDDLALARQVMRDLRDHFDTHLSSLVDPKRPVAWALDQWVADLIGPLHATYRRARDLYAQARGGERALDFDDLEAGAVALLEDPDVRTAWQEQVHAVLVDEFQDTNERQREIVYALSGFAEYAMRNMPGSLFVVGDAKQSIYRFRGADVTVFRRVQSDVSQSGGQVLRLDRTFRPHRPLVETTNRLLAPALDEVARPGRLYAVPFTSLEAARTAPRAGIAPPFVEFLLGLGDSASAGREAAADLLATRLLEMHAQEDVAWEDVALLFRASTTFSVYEDALERAGIPFVTVAGRGFYERYEVRDLLNALLAAADPTDDLALTGFLRSPAVGLTDAALYRLRFPPPAVVEREPHQACSIWSTLHHTALPEIVPGDDLARAVRGRDLVAELHELAGRVPVAALLKRLLDRTSYRAALEAVEGGPRALRNVDKLLTDAHTSGLVSVREFLEYVDTLRDVGARESEAPTEAGSAVQLMTVHKAKGLEFPIVVIADAARRSYRGRGPAHLDDQLGVTLDLRAGPDDDRRAAAHRLAALRDADRNEAEERRLLYVAVTRAQEKVLVSGHVKLRKGGALSLNGWLELLGREAGLDEVEIADPPSEPWTLPLAHGVEGTISPWKEQSVAHPAPELVADPRGGAPARDLVAPLVAPPSGLDPKLREQEARPPRRVWRVVPRTERTRAPAWVIGTLVHAALRHWRFDEELEAFLRPFAWEAGVVDESEIRAALRAAHRILDRFHGHPLWAEIDAAERWHEVPYSIEEDGQVEHGVIDLLYRAGAVWRIVEFKSDRLQPEERIQDHIQRKSYDEQVQRYVGAFRQQLGAEVEGVLVFLNAGGQVAIVPVQ